MNSTVFSIKVNKSLLLMCTPKVRLFWKGYNKLDTKLREIVERFIMARRKFDKQFKNSAVKLILEEGY
ncbi:hypothetical protein Tome1A_00765, partial [Lactococcus lactis subsp. lactis]